MEHKSYLRVVPVASQVCGVKNQLFTCLCFLNGQHPEPIGRSSVMLIQGIQSCRPPMASGLVFDSRRVIRSASTSVHSLSENIQATASWVHSGRQTCLLDGAERHIENTLLTQLVRGQPFALRPN
ncbi:hypothetical protein TNCT_207691 [Trichonephila clavata]|uniref:Uncharacterized protein n=1 Tax=Trichonephila clavata TaxID=2740835 RepID=A0A8X6FSD5_TRICU|nr:hypothetical protein TNCT_207691 [Trichonephila clavata]